MGLNLATTVEANELLARDPFALLLGMLLDQQITMEKAFTSPHLLASRLGRATLDAREIAEYDADAFEVLFREVPALHRFPAAMANRTQALCQALVRSYDGDAVLLWSTARSGSQLLRRIAELPGFGEQKAKIFVALLGKQFDVCPRGWRAAAGHYGEPGSHRSIADVTDAASLKLVRQFKKEQKAAAQSPAKPATQVRITPASGDRAPCLLPGKVTVTRTHCGSGAGRLLVFATPVLLLIACSGSSGHHPPTQVSAQSGSAQSGSAPAQGDAVAAITDAYTAFISPTRSVDSAVALLQDGEAFRPTLVQLATSPFVSKVVVSVSAVAINSATKATVTYTVAFAGIAVLTNQTGYAVKEDGTWKVAGATVCSLLSSQGKSSPACTVASATTLPS